MGGGQKGVDERRMGISYLDSGLTDCCRDTTFVMGRYEWDWELGRRLNFEIPLIAFPLSPLLSSSVWHSFAGALAAVGSSLFIF